MLLRIFLRQKMEISHYRESLRQIGWNKLAAPEEKAGVLAEARKREFLGWAVDKIGFG